MIRVHPDGRRDFFLHAEPGYYLITGHQVDVQLRDSDGKDIADSKRDRIDTKRRLADMVCAYHSDETLATLLRSYSAAVRDPNNELVHLYEIRDAPSTRFGRERGTCSALGISSTAWSRFGQLCNHAPLRQGRHRGNSGPALRNATESELLEARGIAREMIEAYLLRLESRARP